jgi:hypothetical protein
MRRWLDRLRALLCGILLLAVVAIVVGTIASSFYAPTKLRNIALKISRDTGTFAKFLPDALPTPSADRIYRQVHYSTIGLPKF